MNNRLATAFLRHVFNGDTAMRVLAGAALLTILGASALAETPLSSSEPKALIAEERAANETCRSTDGTRATELACERRAAYAMRLNEIGWCFGKRGQGGAEMTWHACTRTSYHYGD